MTRRIYYAFCALCGVPYEAAEAYRNQPGFCGACLNHNYQSTKYLQDWFHGCPVYRARYDKFIAEHLEIPER